jgi:hypothetical protein
MGDLDDRLRKMEIELEALRRIKTQEDHDEGARLHALHNAPWVKGAYSHLEFPPYQFRAFPAAIYRIGFTKAYQAWQQAQLVPAHGTDDILRKQAVLMAERELAQCTRKVDSEEELRKWLLTREWFESPEALVAHEKAVQRDLELAASHRAYEDRNMGDQARAEIERFDDEAENFVAEIPRTPVRRATRIATESTVKAAAQKATSGHGEGEGQSGGRKVRGAGK